MNVRYRIVQAAAGEGGFGRVDKAIDNELEREVAIKTLDPLFKAKPSAKDIERFRREAKALARLSHPNIPAIYDVQFSEASGEFKIVFEWIEGQTLRDHLQANGVLSLEDARQLFSRICSALSHAHSNDIITATSNHRTSSSPLTSCLPISLTLASPFARTTCPA